MSKIPNKSKRTTIRDEMACRLGISRTAFSEYRRIIKLPDKKLQSIARLLDEKRISFESAYVISNMIDTDIDYLIEEIDLDPNLKLNLDRLKELPKRNEKKSGRIIHPVTKKRVVAALRPHNPQL